MQCCNRHHCQCLNVKRFVYAVILTTAAVRVGRYLTLELPGGTQLLEYAIQGWMKHHSVAELQRYPEFRRMVATARQEPLWRRRRALLLLRCLRASGRAHAHNSGCMPRRLRCVPRVCSAPTREARRRRVTREARD